MLNLVETTNGVVVGTQPVGASVNYSPEFSEPEPNANLLRRIAESGGGKILDPADPIANPFLHDRQKTFQPRDLWETLLKFAIILFCFDVGIRRIQLDREEWLRLTQTLRRWIFFWQPPPRPAEAEESLAALLARRDAVRSRQTAPAMEPHPDLFRPEGPITVHLPGEEPATAAAPKMTEGRGESVKTEEEAQPASTTSRLLEAKRRAQKRKP